MTRFRLQRIWRAQSGLTLVELLAVVVILVILSLMAVPLIGEVTDRARTARAQEDLRLLSDMLEAYKAHEGHYPERLWDLVTGNYLKPGELESAWSGGDEDDRIYYYYGTDKDYRPDAYVIGDPGNNGDISCNGGPKGDACPLSPDGEGKYVIPDKLKFYRTSW